MRRVATIAALVSALLWVATAQARKPVIAYVNQGTGKLVFYDAELGRTVAGPSPSIPIGPRFSVSFNGRFVFYADAAKKLHLIDRATGGERNLPGIDPAGFTPAGLSVSDGGLLAFDDNSNGPAVAYDSNTKQFVPTGLPANNGHRQSHLTADGKLLATTCVTGAAKCVVESGGSDSDLFVQNLTTRTDTAFPDNIAGADQSEEHPCVNSTGSLVGGDVGPSSNRDLFLYSRANPPGAVTPTALKSASMEVNCVLDASGNYVGLDDNAGNFKMYDRAAASFVTLGATISPPAWFSSPYTPPPTPPGTPGGGPPPVPPGGGGLAAVISHVSAHPSKFRARGAGGKGTKLAFTLNEAAGVLVTIGPARRFRALMAYKLTGRAGANSLRVDGRGMKRRHHRRRPLKPGRYLIHIAAVGGAGTTAASVSLPVRILPKKH
jgi:hypothetical protein